MKEIKCESEGEFTIKEIKYAGQIITFKANKELKIEYAKYEGEDYISVEYDFGMIIHESIKRTGFLDLNEKSTVEEIARRTVKYDVEHAFCHEQMDPNYVEIHWAIKGWLKDRVIITDDPEEME
jgi:hypothetical protein